MKNNDIRTREELRQALQQAAVSGDTGAFSSVLDEMMQRIGLDIQAEYEQRFDDLRQEVDSRILAARSAATTRSWPQLCALPTPGRPSPVWMRRCPRR